MKEGQSRFADPMYATLQSVSHNLNGCTQVPLQKALAHAQRQHAYISQLTRPSESDAQECQSDAASDSDSDEGSGSSSAADSPSPTGLPLLFIKQQILAGPACASP